MCPHSCVSSVVHTRTPPRGVGGSSLRPSLMTAVSSGKLPRSDAPYVLAGLLLSSACTTIDTFRSTCVSGCHSNLLRLNRDCTQLGMLHACNTDCMLLNLPSASTAVCAAQTGAFGQHLCGLNLQCECVTLGTESASSPTSPAGASPAAASSSNTCCCMSGCTACVTAPHTATH
jgi:hypothetical protein